MALACFAGRPAFAQQDLSQVEIKATPVAGKVHMLQGAGGNIGVSVGPDGILIVDDQFAPLAEKIRAALKKLGEGKLKFVLNTHWHGDHTGGNREFGRETPIIAHSNVRRRLATDQALMNRTVPASPKEALPVITFDESLSVHFNGEEIRAIHFPRAHTDGDSVIFFTGSNVVHMGDLFFSGRFPFIDLASGGDVEGYAKAVEEMIGRIPAGARIIPGHGPLSGIDELEVFHQMIVESMAHVRKRVSEGKGLKEIQTEGVPEKWKPWSWEFISADRWLEVLHTSLTRGSGTK